jgi:hypothetical protein
MGVPERDFGSCPRGDRAQQEKTFDVLWSVCGLPEGGQDILLQIWEPCAGTWWKERVIPPTLTLWLLSWVASRERLGNGATSFPSPGDKLRDNRSWKVVGDYNQHPSGIRED